MAKVLQLVTSCRECPKRAYYSSGKDECTAVSGRGGPKIVPNDGSTPEWCPLADWPASAAPVPRPEYRDVRLIMALEKELGCSPDRQLARRILAAVDEAGAADAALHAHAALPVPIVSVDAVLDAALEAVNDNDLAAAAVILRNAKTLLAGQKVLTEEQCDDVADRAFAFFEVPARERDEGLARYIIQLTIEALSGAAPAGSLGDTEEFREAAMCFRKAAWERDHDEMLRWQRRIFELARSWRGTGAATAASGEPLAWLIECPATESSQASRSVHLHNAIGDYRALNPAASVTPLAPICGATEQALGLYAEQAEVIRELLDKHAPNTTGNLQARLAQVLQRKPDGYVRWDEEGQFWVSEITEHRNPWARQRPVFFGEPLPSKYETDGSQEKGGEPKA